MYIFRKEQDPSNEHDVATIEFRIDSHTGLAELIQEFTYFLRACSFQVDGDLEITDFAESKLSAE